MVDDVLQLLDEIDAFTLNVSSYFSDSEYVEFVDEVMRGKINALSLCLERLCLDDHVKELRRLKFDRSELIPIIEVLKKSIVPNIRRALDEGGRFECHNNLFAQRDIRIWENLRFRTSGEVKIAAALDEVGAFFLPNCRGRLGGTGKRENREPDFLVCHQGKWGILEVDGRSHAPSRTVDDHDRDRLFKLHGVRVVEHFDDAECFENAKGVVAKFLKILSQSG